MLAKEGCVVTGVDIEPEAIEKARKFYGGPNYILGDIKDRPWKETFDWCVSFETIEHLKEPEKALKAFRESCHKLIVSTPNQDFYPFDLKKFNGEKYPHQRHYTPKELENLLYSCDWEVMQRFCQVGKRDRVTQGTNGMFILMVCQ